jgi:hypothetical protein
MKKLIYLAVWLVFIGCSESEEPESNLFREIYKNTFWEVDFQLFTFDTDKLVLIGTEASCNSWEVGNFNNVDYDGCVYTSVSYVVNNENKSSFSFKETVSLGKAPNGALCNGQETTVSFEIINENEMKVNISDGKNSETFTIKKSTKKFVPSNCKKGPSNTGLF